MDVSLAFDIGGTKILVAAADPEGSIEKPLRAPTPSALEEGLDLLRRMARECAAGRRIRSIGASIGGPLDWKAGIVSPLHQPQWRSLPLKALMERTFACPFLVDVDTNVAALGEWKARRGLPRRLLYLTISTGMGGGWIVDGKVFRGPAGEHPEVAHQAVPLVESGRAPLCECGARGCLEELVSGNGIRRRYGKPAEELSTDQWAAVGTSLGLGLRNLSTILVPDLIAIGGGVALGGGERLLGPARDVARSGLKLVALPPIEPSVLGDETALRGALALALEGAQLLGD